MVSTQFFLGLPGFHFVYVSQYKTCFGNLPSSIRKICPNHLSLLSLMITSSVCSDVISLTSSFQTSSFQEMTSIICLNSVCCLSVHFAYGCCRQPTTGGPGHGRHRWPTLARMAALSRSGSGGRNGSFVFAIYGVLLPAFSFV